MTRDTVLVTGATRGIGCEIARQLVARGDRVIVSGRNLAAVEATVAELTVGGVGPGGDAIGARLDVTDQTSVDAAAEMLAERVGALDGLVNNAAIHYDTWQRASAADLSVVDEALATNLVGAWRVTLAMLPLLRRSDHPRIVNVSSEAGSINQMSGGVPAYATSKAALNALTRLLAGELRSEGFLVNAVCPGWVATDMGGAGGRPVPDGAASVIWALDLADDGPTGGFYRDGQPLDW